MKKILHKLTTNRQLQEEKAKLERIGRLVNEIRTIAFPVSTSSAPGSQSDHQLLLQAEQDEHNKTKQTLEEIQVSILSLLTI